MKIGGQISVSGQISIVDLDDDNAPLITFHNEFNKEEVAINILEFIGNNYSTSRTLADTKVKPFGRFDILDFEE